MAPKRLTEVTTIFSVTWRFSNNYGLYHWGVWKLIYGCFAEEGFKSICITSHQILDFESLSTSSNKYIKRMMIKKGCQNITKKVSRSVCHLKSAEIRDTPVDKTLWTGSGCRVRCEISKWSIFMSNKMKFHKLVLEFTYRAYEILKYTFLIIFR